MMFAAISAPRANRPLPTELPMPMIRSRFRVEAITALAASRFRLEAVAALAASRFRLEAVAALAASRFRLEAAAALAASRFRLEVAASLAASRLRLRALALAAFTLLAAPAAASTCHAVSASLTRPLVELYTSEGCNSCPPADRWLSARFPAKAMNSGAVAVAFHVDYWDRLGWVDRFANPSYTERQYAGMRANASTFVYTPQVLLQGRDFAWQSGREGGIDAAARTPARALIVVDVASDAASHHVTAKAHVADAALAKDARLFVALADSGHHSDVRAGENRGARLLHDHVVRGLRMSESADASGNVTLVADFTRPAEPGTSAQVVAFVQRTSNGDVLQTLPVPLDECASP